MINGKIALHIYAPALSLSGYGAAARQIVDYCVSDSRFIVFLENVPWGHCSFIHENILIDKEKIKLYYQLMAAHEQAKQQNIKFDISIYCTIPNEFQRRASVCIGATAGIETDRITQNWINSCNMMDLLVVPSTFSRDIILGTAYETKNNATGEVRSLKVERPVEVIPHWFEKPSVIKNIDLKFSTKNNFLFVGMWGNKGGFGEDRKDIATLIKVFYDSFANNKDVGLILKTEIINNSAEDLLHIQKKLKEIAKNYPNAKCKVYLLHDMLTEEEMWGLYNHPDIKAFVSFGVEGFGLGHLQALACGKPVLGLDWSGHKDFCKKGNGFIPLDYSMKDVPDCQVWENVIDKGARWARVDMDEASRRMKKFISSPEKIEKQAKDNVEKLINSFSKEEVIKKWKSFFDSFLNPQEVQKVQNEVYKTRKEQEVDRLKTRYSIVESNKEKILYVMPMSFGDIVMSTCIVDSLITNRHHDDEFYFATKKEYFTVLDGLVSKYGIKVIEYDDILVNSEITREIWDTVYTPGVNVQYNFSNWTLGNGKYALNLLQEFAKQCNLAPFEITDYLLAPAKYPLPKKKYICLTAVSSKDAKKYKYWADVVENLKSMLNEEVDIVQLGMKSEDKIPGTIDYRGISFNEGLYVIQNSILHIGPDTGMGHAAAALKVPHFVIFASTAANQCAPHLTDLKALQSWIETDCHCTGRSKSYKDVCKLDDNGLNCLSKISAEEICNKVFKLLKAIEELSNNEKLQKQLDDQKYIGYPSNQALFDDVLKDLRERNKENEQETASV